ncbi:MAG TPA: enoyl-CoA hydratase/isomerase family protein [Acidimicrobiales bacterium]|nr:enoyl-CoA hydratase/isomerase family protein [Acidimicrobiales bacterium]
MPFRELSYETVGEVGVITLDRPEARNALTRRTYRELEEAVRTTEARCLVVTGADPAFCAGDDVKLLMVPAGEAAAGTDAGDGDSPAAGGAGVLALTPAAEALLTTDVPVVAAVNGAAVGWGMELALMADIRVASERARFGELFVKRGLCCDVAGLGRLASLVGRERAADLLFTGRIFDADEAAAIGLVSRVVPHRDLLPTALGLAQRIAANPPLAVQRLKQGLRTALDPDWESLGRWVGASLTELFRTEDHREGVASFLERREPHFVGR